MAGGSQLKKVSALKTCPSMGTVRDQRHRTRSNKQYKLHTDVSEDPPTFPELDPYALPVVTGQRQRRVHQFGICLLKKTLPDLIPS